MSTKYFDCESLTVPGQHIRSRHHSTAHTQEEQLQLAIKKYTPRIKRERLDQEKVSEVTIIACHAAGMMKELYEPLFDDLFQTTEKMGSKWRIRSVWIADIVTHGESAALNEGKLGFDYHWDDHARDLLHMVNVFRDQMPQPMVGIGHSMGAVNIIQLSLLHPRLFAAIIPIEVVLKKEHSMNVNAAFVLVKRKDVWASRQEAFAATATQKAAWMRSFDSRVLERWKEYGFRELPTLLHSDPPAKVTRKASEMGTKPVTLATTKYHEVNAHTRPAHPAAGQSLDSFIPNLPLHPDITKEEHDGIARPFYRPEHVLTFRQLPTLRAPCLYVYGGSSFYASAKGPSRRDKLETTGTAPGGSGGQKTGSVAQVIIPKHGHFVPLEKPDLVASEIVVWLGPMIARWKSQYDLQTEMTASLNDREMTMVDENHRYWAEKWYSPPKAAAKL